MPNQFQPWRFVFPLKVKKKILKHLHFFCWDIGLNLFGPSGKFEGEIWCRGEGWQPQYLSFYSNFEKFP